MIEINLLRNRLDDPCPPLTQEEIYPHLKKELGTWPHYIAAAVLGNLVGYCLTRFILHWR